MLKKVELGPSSTDLASLDNVLPAFFSPFGGSAETADTNNSEPVIAQANVFLMFIKFSTVLISIFRTPRRIPVRPF
jgi:hypothetical protein